MEHSIADALLTEQELRAMADGGIANVPTLIIAQLLAAPEAYDRLPERYRTEFIDREMDIRRDYIKSRLDDFTEDAIRNANVAFPGNWENLLKGARTILGTEEGLLERTIADGLKEAIQAGTVNAVRIVSRAGGYYNNPAIKIFLPGPVQKVEKLIKMAGYGDQVDAFELSMNQAARHLSGCHKAHDRCRCPRNSRWSREQGHTLF